MESTKTVDELFIEFFGRDIAEALDDVDVEVVETADADIGALTQLVDQCLQPEVSQAISRVDLTAEMLEVEIDVGQGRFAIRVQGLSLILILLTFAVFTIGIEPVQILLQALLSTQ